MQIEDADAKLLIEQMKQGEIVLVLGAGIHKGSKNRHNSDIADTKVLSTLLAKSMGESYAGEDLSIVTSAYKEMKGDSSLNDILIQQFRYCKPSIDLESIFSYTWNKIYTWNIDDSLEIASGKSVQRLHFYNGISSKVEMLPKYENLPIIYLHGSVKEIDKGVIFTREEYASQLQEGGHEWYKELSSDYVRSSIIFIGSSMKEPILESEIQRASKIVGRNFGRSYVITPDNLSNIERNALKQRGLTHIKSDLHTFIEWLGIECGKKITPKHVLTKHGYSQISDIRLSADEIQAAHSLYPRKPEDLRAKYLNMKNEERMRLGREFLNGFSPSWLLASSDIPVKLHQFSGLKNAIKTSANEKSPICVVHGQAGSGKTTATMMAMLELGREDGFEIYEVSNDIDSLRSAFNFLERVSDSPKLVYISNLATFSHAISEDFPDALRANATIITTIRSNEWSDRFERYIAPSAEVFKFERFDKLDHEPLLERLRSYVPAPQFIKLPPHEQRKKLESSKSQLLMALREATGFGRFDEVIIDEYSHIKDEDARNLFLIVGISSLSRVGIDRGAASFIYSKICDQPFNDSLKALSGIVRINSEDRLIARHDLYVRTILDRAVDAEVLFARIGDIAEYFTRFDTPIIKHAGRANATLFKHILNFRFLLERGKAVSEPEKGLDVFQRFEVPFQLDGHFWLQYGLLTRNLGDRKGATKLLQKSIDAFPGNAFAIHALAQAQLIEAANRPNFDSETKRLLHEGHAALMNLLEQPQLKIDQYPIVTLANFHVNALIAHDKVPDAKSWGRKYFEIISAVEEDFRSYEIRDAKTRLLKFVSANVWIPAPYD